MILLGPKTIRTKLTLTTMIVMGLLLGMLGVLIDVTARRTLLGSVDGELKNRAHEFGAGHRHFGPGRNGDGMGGPPPDFLGGLLGGGGDPQRRRFPRRDTKDTRPRFIEATPRASRSDGPSPDEPYDKKAAEAAKHAKEGLFSTITVGGVLTRVYSEPVREGGVLRGVAQAAYPIADVMASLDGLRNILLTVVIPLGVVLAGAASLFLVERLLRPVRLLNENAATIGGSNLEERLPVVGADEFAGLATTLNGMLSRLEVAFRLEQATTRRLEETVEQQRRFTADASHELKTPLATIKAHMGLLRMGELAEEDRESVDAADVAANRMRSLVDDLLVLARADGGSLTAKTTPVDLAEVVSAAVAAVSPTPVEVRGAPRPLMVNGNGEALARLFINLLDNARKYAGTSEPVEVRLAKRGDAAEVAVVDRGVGIAPEHLPRLFDRFYRPDTSRTSDTGGTGLGLAICREIAAAHGGTIEVESRVGQGTTFTVVLPLAG